MAATKLFMNWTTVTWTPLPSGTPVTIDKVTSVKPKLDTDVERFKGDADRFYRAIASPTNNRSVDVDTGDISALLLIPVNTPGTLSATLGDVYNGFTAGGGGITITLTPCICTGRPFSGDHAKFASGTATFEGYSPTDGVTDPLTVVAL